ncbi:unnamed protein product [Medioppia subpectinata]|uniref:Uncharacterized protein n=1 Tax=Medioppia subpectinata TaxID=1979941 RepID=A0A7R9KX53_9ACAR|nr:unnamed protein product [Medioppia subpectinata]CAG2110195.1 unnamed protein product [Medioppia subpectinata]
MLKALRKHLKASQKSTSFMQYMKINRKEEQLDQLDNNWINFRNIDDLANDLVEHNVYGKGFDLINTNNISNCNENYYCNYKHERQTHEKKRIECEIKDETKIKDVEAIQLNRQHLHALHRFRRHKKRGISCEKDVVISFVPKTRVSIVNKRDFYYRFGKEEEEAMACFDFLNHIQCDNHCIDCNESDSSDGSPCPSCPSWPSIDLRGDSDVEVISEDRNSQLSLSDSCVEYYDSSD